jgi:hypothetical protein
LPHLGDTRTSSPFLTSDLMNETTAWILVPQQTGKQNNNPIHHGVQKIAANNDKEILGKQKLLPNKKSLVTPKKKVSKKRKADPPIPPYEPGS